MPAAQTAQENCVAHNGSLIPVPGRDIMVQAWYQGGVSVVRFHRRGASEGDRVLRPRPGRLDQARRSAAPGERTGTTATSYGSEIARGLDILSARAERASSRRTRSTRPISSASTCSIRRRQPHIVWPASYVGGARVSRSAESQQGLTPERAAAVKAGIDRAEKASGEQKTAALDALDALTKDLDKDASAATGLDAVRLQNARVDAESADLVAAVGRPPWLPSGRSIDAGVHALNVFHGRVDTWGKDLDEQQELTASTRRDEYAPHLERGVHVSGGQVLHQRLPVPARLDVNRRRSGPPRRASRFVTARHDW